MEITDIVLVGGLSVLAVADWKNKTIPVYPVLFFGVISVIYRLWSGTGCVELFLGAVPGLVLLLLAFCTGESIGKGDGLVFCMMGLACGLKKTFAVLSLSLIVSALAAIILLIGRKVGKKTELPFLPSVLCGYLLCLI